MSVQLMHGELVEIVSLTLNVVQAVLLAWVASRGTRERAARTIDSATARPSPPGPARQPWDAQQDLPRPRESPE